MPHESESKPIINIQQLVNPTLQWSDLKSLLLNLNF